MSRMVRKQVYIQPAQEGTAPLNRGWGGDLNERVR